MSVGQDQRLEDLMLLAEAQAEQLDAAKRRIGELEAHLARRATLAEVHLDEIRGPLGNAWSMLANAPVDNPEIGAYITAALDELRRAQSLVDEAGRRPPASPEPAARVARREVVVIDLLHDVVHQVRTRHPHGHAQHVNVEAPAALSMVTSPPRLAGLLVAIIDNAFRHGKHPISVRARAHGRDSVRFDVIDQGPGFRSRRPVQATASGRADHRGHEGVGLFVARLLAHTLGGTVAAGDQLGGGAVVSVVLPQRRQDDPPQAGATVADLQIA